MRVSAFLSGGISGSEVMPICSFINIVKLISVVVVPIPPLTSSEWEFQFFHISVDKHLTILCVSHFSHAGGCLLVLDYGFNLYLHDG